MWHRVVLVLAVACIAAAGCTKVSTSTQTPHARTEAGVLRISDISDPSTLNPMLTGADVAYALASYSLEYLVQLDDKGDVVPVLCERVPSTENGDISKDGLSITYHLRKGVTWQDGQPFTADDVVATWRQIMNPLNPVQIREGYEAIARIDEPDKHTAVLRLRRPYAPLTTRFLAGIQEGPIAVLPAHLIADQKDLVHSPLNAKPVGTGPYIVQSWVHNGELIYVANPHYWRGAPKIRKIIFQAQPSESTEIVGFQTHEIDADFDTGPADLPSYRLLKGMRVSQSHSLRLSVMVMNTQTGPLRERAVRGAVVAAIDRSALARNVYHGAAVLADEFLPQWSWGYTPDVPHYPFDPKAAAQTLEAAGWKADADGIRSKNGERLSLVIVGTAGSDASKHLNTILQSYLRAIGVEVIIKDYPYGMVFNIDGPIRQGRFNLATFTYSVNYDPSALQDDGCDQFAPAGANDSRYCDPQVDRLEREALAIYDRTKRKPLYARIQQLRMTDLAELPMFFRDRVGVLTQDLTGYRPSVGIMPNWNSWQWELP